MKNIIFIILLTCLSFTACKDQAEKKENNGADELVTHSTDSVSEKEKNAVDYLYKSDNGEILSVNFFEENEKRHIKINRENEDELVLDETTTSSDDAEYVNGDYKWTHQNDHAIFSNGTETMKLVLISPLQYTFSNDQENISITYFSKNDKRFVTIEKDNEVPLTLEQTTAWAKGAEYGTGNIQWRGNGTKGVLIENGEETHYTQKEFE